MRIEPLEVCIARDATLFDAMKRLSELGMKKRDNMLLVVDDRSRLVGTLTDGDIRRAYLRGCTPKERVDHVCQKSPIVVHEGMSRGDITHLMRVNGITNIPVVTDDMTVLRVESDGRIEAPGEGDLVAVIMAGGEGVRLRPLTEDTPKPMLHVGGRPILETLLGCLKSAGFTRIILNVRYLANVIREHFGDGSRFELDIQYVTEPHPMGTAGSLGIIPDAQKPQAPFLVVNGDLLTALNFRAFYDFHVAAGYDFTLCGRPYHVRVPFGYPVVEGDVVTAFQEKPTFTHLVNSGIYCLSPDIIEEVPPGEYMDMPDLIRRAIETGRRVGVFPLREEFHEIGRPESFEKAEAFYAEHFGEARR